MRSIVDKAAHLGEDAGEPVVIPAEELGNSPWHSRASTADLDSVPCGAGFEDAPLELARPLRLQPAEHRPRIVVARQDEHLAWLQGVESTKGVVERVVSHGRKIPPMSAQRMLAAIVTALSRGIHDRRHTWPLHH